MARAGRKRRWFWPLVFRLALLLGAFGGGLYVAGTEVAPWRQVSWAAKKARDLVRARTVEKPLLQPWEATGLRSSALERRRVAIAEGDGLAAPAMATGGTGQFREHCPGARGCLAVEYSAAGEIVRAWPFRPPAAEGALAAAPVQGTFGIAGEDVVDVAGVARYPNGDLLVVYRHLDFHSPDNAGLARVGGSGRVLWHRRDYSRGEPYVAAGDTAFVLGKQRMEDAAPAPRVRGWSCESGEAVRDIVNVLDGDGRLLEQVSLLGVLLESPWAPELQRADPCSPVHANSVSLVGEDVSGSEDVRPGDVVLSLRNLNAVAILDRATYQMKQFARGTFQRPHSAKHWRGTEFVLFDGGGGRARRDGGLDFHSRVLRIDVENGRETVVFPKDPQRFGWHAEGGGRISIGPDKTTLIASFDGVGRAVEVRIEDGAALAQFDHLHDLSGLPSAGLAAGVVRFPNPGMFYATEAR